MVGNRSVDQAILDTTVTTCREFYRAVADHADLIPKISADLVSLLVTDASEETKQQLVETIVAMDPRQFEDIFSSRFCFPRRFCSIPNARGRVEGRFFNIAHRISWWAGSTQIPVPAFRNLPPQRMGMRAPPKMQRRPRAITASRSANW